jgi:hypothetical protein
MAGVSSTRHPQFGTTPEDTTSGQIGNDRRRLRALQIRQRIPRSRNYQVTAGDLTLALFLTQPWHKDPT